MKKHLLKSLALAAALLVGGGTAKADGYVDVTSLYLTNAALTSDPRTSGNGWTVTKSGGGNDPSWQSGALEFYHTWGSGTVTTNQTFNVAQSVTLPAGDYKLSWQGFYRETLSVSTTEGATEKAFIYATDGSTTASTATDKTYLQLQYGTSENSLSEAASSFASGTHANELTFTLAADATIEIGFDGYISTYGSWCPIGPVTLYQMQSNFENYQTLYSQLTTISTSYTAGSTIGTSALKAVTDALTTYANYDETTDETTLATAVEALNEVLTTANTSIANYSSASLGTAVNDVTNWATTITNSSGTGNIELNTWSTEADVSGVKTNFVQTWIASGSTLTDNCETTYTLSGLDKGTYQVTVTVRIFNEGTTNGVTGSLNLSVNGGTAIDAVANGVSAIYNRASSEVFGTFTVIGEVGSDGVLTFTAANSSTGFNWVAYKDITVSEYNAESLATELTSLSTQTMSAAVSEQITGVTSSSDAATLVAAVNAARQSVSLYSILADYLPSIIYPEHTGYTRGGTSFLTATYPTNFSTIETAYSEKTATDANLVYLQVEGFNAYRTYERQIVSDNITASAYVTNTTFEDSSSDGWEYTTGAYNKGVLTGQSTNVDFTNGYLWENWKYSGDGGLNGDMKQTVTNLPSGRYALKMVAFTRDNSLDNYGYIKNTSGTESHGVTLAAATPFIVLTDPVEVTDGTVEIGLHVGSGCDWAALGQVELLAVEIYDHERSSSSSTYGTICLPYNFTATNATVYTAALSDDNTAVELTEVTADYLTKGVAYIYQASDASQAFEAVYNANLIAAPVEDENAVLQGTFVETTATAGTYVLQTHGDTQAFYLVGDVTPDIPAYRAYLKAISGDVSEVRIAKDSDLTDGIEAVETIEALTSGSAEIYDLSGRKLSKLQKGVNIVNGRKVVVK